jgi:hypothetical protein
MTSHPHLGLRWLWLLGLVAVLAIAYGAASYLLSGSARGLNTSTGSFFVSPSGSDSGRCSQSAPCASFAMAYQVASPGDKVQVESGSYPRQTITWPNAKPAGSNCRWGAPFPSSSVLQDLSGCITFKPAAGASVTLAGFSISAPYVRLDGFTVNGGVTLGWDGNAAGGNCDQQRAHDIVLSNLTQTGGMYIAGVSQVYLVNDSTGGAPDSGTQVQPCDPASINNLGAYVNTDHVALIGVTVHDVITNNPQGHTEGIHWQDTSYGYVAKSKFLNNDQQDISFHPRDSNDHLDHFLIENNVFDAPCSNHSNCPAGPIGAITWGCDPGTMLDVTVRFNSYNGADVFDGTWNGGASKCQSIQSYGNIVAGPQTTYECSYEAGKITDSYDVFTGSGPQCGTGNSLNNPISSIYTNPTPTAYDYTEKTGSPSIDFYPLTQAFPTIDALGVTRPQGPAPDAGAYER